MQSTLYNVQGLYSFLMPNISANFQRGDPQCVCQAEVRKVEVAIFD